MEAIADMDSFDRLDLSENRYLRLSFYRDKLSHFTVCHYILPHNKDSFVAKCNHIVKSNKK